MTQTPRRVLLVGFPGPELRHFSPALISPQTVLDIAATWSEGLARIAAEPFTTVLARFPSDGASLAELVRAMRSPASPCLNAGAIVLAAPESLRAATDLIGHGVNKVISTLESPEVLACVVMRLESVAAPDGERIAVRLPLECSVGGMRQRWRTENLSLRGVLAATEESVKVGTSLRFRLVLPGQERAVEGELKVTRVTTEGHETVQGFGARFVTLAGDGRSRLAAFVDEYRTRPRP